MAQTGLLGAISALLATIEVTRYRRRSLHRGPLQSFSFNMAVRCRPITAIADLLILTAELSWLRLVGMAGLARTAANACFREQHAFYGRQKAQNLGFWAFYALQRLACLSRLPN